MRVNLVGLSVVWFSLASSTFAITINWNGNGGTTSFGTAANWSQDPEFSGVNPRVSTNIHRIAVAATVSTAGTNYNYVATTIDHASAIFEVTQDSSVTNAGGTWVEGTVDIYGRMDNGVNPVSSGNTQDDITVNVYQGGVWRARGNNSFGGNINHNRDVTINLWGEVLLRVLLVSQWGTGSTNNNFLINVHTGAIYQVNGSGSANLTLRADANTTSRVEMRGGYMDLIAVNNFIYQNVTNTPGNGIIFKSADSLIRVAAGDVTADIQDWIDSGAVSSDVAGFNLQSEYIASSNATFLKVVSVGASDRIWDGGGTDDQWTTAANWQDDVAPRAGDSLFFAGSTRLINTNNFSAGTAFSTLVFNGGAGSFTLRGSTIALSGGITNFSSSSQTLEHGLSLNDVHHFYSSGGDLILRGNVDGSGGVVKLGNGLLELAGTNTYEGEVVLDGGTLTLSGNHSGSSPALIVSNGLLNVNHANALGTRSLHLAGGSLGNTSGADVTNAGHGPVSIDASITFAGPSNLDLGNGLVSFGDTLAITFSGTSNQLVMGTVTNTGMDGSNTRTITISGGTGTLMVDDWYLASGSASATNTIAGSGNLTIQGDVANGGSSTASGFDFTGSGVYTLNGNNTFDGAIRLMANGGTLTLAGDNSGMTGNVYLGGPGALNINHAHALGSGPVNLNGGILDNTSGAAIANAGDNEISINGDVTFLGSSDLDLGNGSVDAGWLAPLSGARTLTINSGTLTMGVVSNTSTSVSLSNGNRTQWTVNGPGNLLIDELFINDFFQPRGLVLDGSAHVTIQGPVGASGGTSGGEGHFFTYRGTGTVIMNGNTTYYGPTTVSSGGTLVVNGSVLSNRLVASTGGTLYGSGSAPRAVLEGGVFSPAGSGVGSFINVDSLDLDSGTLRIDINNADGSPGTNWDVMNVGNGNGSVTNLGGVGSVTVMLVRASTSLPGFDGLSAKSWIIIDAGSQSGFSTSQYVIDTSSFGPVEKYNGVFDLTSSNGDVVLHYTPVVTEVDLSAVIIASTNYALAGSPVTFTFVIRNHSSQASGVYYVTNSFSEHVTIVDYSDGGATNNSDVIWALANLEGGSSTSLTVTVMPVYTGSTNELSNVVSSVVATAYDDPNPGNNTADPVNVTTVGIPMMSDLAMLLLGGVMVVALWRLHRRALEA